MWEGEIDRWFEFTRMRKEEIAWEIRIRIHSNGKLVIASEDSNSLACGRKRSRGRFEFSQIVERDLAGDLNSLEKRWMRLCLTFEYTRIRGACGFAWCFKFARCEKLWTREIIWTYSNIFTCEYSNMLEFEKVLCFAIICIHSDSGCCNRTWKFKFAQMRETWSRAMVGLDRTRTFELVYQNITPF